MKEYQILLFLIVLSYCNCQKFSDLDVSQVLLSGKQAERIAELNYAKACKCQCSDRTVFAKERKRREGNCLTEIDGKYWCFVSDESAQFCRHAEVSPLDNDMMYSLDACYTPAQGEGPCTAEEALKIENETPRNLSCCSIHVGQYDPDTFNKFVGIKFPCYAPNAVQPDEGCEEPIETTWGPARPCRCSGIEYVPGFREITSDAFIHCEIGVASGSKMIEYPTSTAGLSTIQRYGTWKKRSNCVWKKRPSLSGPWKCVSNL